MDIPADAVVVAVVDDQPTQWRTATDLYVIGPDGQVLSRPLPVHLPTGCPQIVREVFRWASGPPTLPA